ncbi:MAG: preQ(1) synthase [Candidatus Margulisiibacteriota bacterium]|nr:preQ(1) synthase [Candidatus Margulisiibacteriota bacterium]
MKKSYKGLQKNIRELKTPKIDTWKNQYPDKDYNIHLENPEFTCVCPKTGLPDFATIFIDYTPDKDCLELKSLKEYFISYRDIGIFHEHLVNKILDDIVKACKPRYAKVVGDINVRGGIKTTVSAEFSK